MYIGTKMLKDENQYRISIILIRIIIIIKTKQITNIRSDADDDYHW